MEWLVGLGIFLAGMAIGLLIARIILGQQIGE